MRRKKARNMKYRTEALVTSSRIGVSVMKTLVQCSGKSFIIDAPGKVNRSWNIQVCLAFGRGILQP
jgi:hypothetical protein